MRALPLLLLLAACEWHVPPREKDLPHDEATTNPADEAAIERRLRADPEIAGVERRADRWDITVVDDGTRRDALAQRVCGEIARNGLAHAGLEILVLDAARRDHVLGRARCTVYPAE